MPDIRVNDGHTPGGISLGHVYTKCTCCGGGGNHPILPTLCGWCYGEGYVPVDTAWAREECMKEAREVCDA